MLTFMFDSVEQGGSETGACIKGLESTVGYHLAISIGNLFLVALWLLHSHVTLEFFIRY